MQRILTIIFSIFLAGLLTGLFAFLMPIDSIAQVSAQENVQENVQEPTNPGLGGGLLEGLGLGGISEDGSQAGGGLSARIIQLIALLTVLTLAPSILMMMTSFIRIVVVLSLLRTALGVQQSPPNPVIISLALFLTAFVMAPTFKIAYTDGIEPYMNEEITLDEAFPLASLPVKQFMLKQTREKDLALFFDMAEITPQTPETTPLHVLAPAFVISELRRAFEIGFLVFIPFLIIDMVISSILMAMGMLMLPPIVISLPFKLVFFVLIDGWRLIAGSLVQSFGAG